MGTQALAIEPPSPAAAAAIDDDEKFDSFELEFAGQREAPESLQKLETYLTNLWTAHNKEEVFEIHLVDSDSETNKTTLAGAIEKVTGNAPEITGNVFTIQAQS